MKGTSGRSLRVLLLLVSIVLTVVVSAETAVKGTGLARASLYNEGDYVSCPHEVTTAEAVGPCGTSYDKPCIARSLQKDSEDCGKCYKLQSKRLNTVTYVRIVDRAAADIDFEMSLPAWANLCPLSCAGYDSCDVASTNCVFGLNPIQAVSKEEITFTQYHCGTNPAGSDGSEQEVEPASSTATPTKVSSSEAGFLSTTSTVASTLAETEATTMADPDAAETKPKTSEGDEQSASEAETAGSDTTAPAAADNDDDETPASKKKCCLVTVWENSPGMEGWCVANGCPLDSGVCKKCGTKDPQITDDGTVVIDKVQSDPFDVDGSPCCVTAEWSLSPNMEQWCVDNSCTTDGGICVRC